MSWIDENNEHEGYLAYITKDGQAAVGTTYGGLLIGHGSDEHLVPWEQLLGWQIRCDCHNEWRDGPLGSLLPERKSPTKHRPRGPAARLRLRKRDTTTGGCTTGCKASFNSHRWIIPHSILAAYNTAHGQG